MEMPLTWGFWFWDGKRSHACSRTGFPLPLGYASPNLPKLIQPKRAGVCLKARAWGYLKRPGPISLAAAACTQLQKTRTTAFSLFSAQLP